MFLVAKRNLSVLFASNSICDTQDLKFDFQEKNREHRDISVLAIG